MARQKKPVHRVRMTEGKRILFIYWCNGDCTSYNDTPG